MSYKTDNFKTLGHRVLITFIEEVEEKVSLGGIILNDGNTKPDPRSGIVAFVPENSEYPFDVGDIVTFGEVTFDSAQETKVNGTPYHMINGSTLFGYFKQPKKKVS